MATSIWKHFCTMPDPRVERTKLHKLQDILTIAFCAVICGAETWVDIADFGKAKESWLRNFLELPNGIPSHDTFGRVFAALDPHGFERCFQAWIADLAGCSEGKLIAIDGWSPRKRGSAEALTGPAVKLRFTWSQHGYMRTTQFSGSYGPRTKVMRSQLFLSFWICSI